ncbi:MAG: dipeptide epimerase [Muribaculaceae bacterium]|nr:dipeptide epimerase [Muribaculaceae bacterium]
MNRRKFLIGSSLGLVAATAPAGLLSACSGERKVAKTGKLTLRFEPYELKLRHAFNLARSSRTTTPDVQVELEYDGIIGYGEASMPPYLGESIESVTKFLSSLDLEQFNDPFRVEDILAYVDSVAEGNRAAKASVDIALHDLLGKIMGQPWYKIWGLDPAKAPVTSFTIGIDTEEVVRQKVEEARPYKLIKVKMGLDKDQETINIIKEMMPDVPICVDVNQGWDSKEKALEMCHWLAERGCLFVEQPFDKTWIDQTAWLTERSPLPIIADEAFQRLPDIVRFKGVYSGINIKLMKSTGLHEAYKMITLARALDMKVMIGCMTETSCAVSAAANLSPLVDYADLDGNLLIANDRFSGMTVVDGKITLRDLPGIGAELL